MYRTFILLLILVFNFNFAQIILSDKSEINRLDDYLISKKFTKKVIKNLKQDLKRIDFETITILINIPGEIITVQENLLFDKKTKNYQVQNNALIEINTTPTDNNFYTIFDNALQKYNLTFSKSNKIAQGIVIKKKSNSYLISSLIYLDSRKRIDKNTFSYEEKPYILEYETFDFENFIPTRYRENDEIEWVEIK